MTAIIAVPPLFPLLEQVVKDPLHRLYLPCIQLVKCQHVYEDDMTFVHEEVAEQVKSMLFTNALGCLDPRQDLLAIGRNNRIVVVMCANAASRLGQVEFDHGQRPERRPNFAFQYPSPSSVCSSLIRQSGIGVLCGQKSSRWPTIPSHSVTLDTYTVLGNRPSRRSGPKMSAIVSTSSSSGMLKVHDM
ncbi:hypothetical protein GGP41_002644 [Bipolaris sorokiniana]|uniref:Uncharacterized protein n=1 Tax=Cochliobolus sativus TaxID=45130 RepID=A0A8H5ZKC5_COCSA|nr:hypothetical protein GGP41_002644 [Bipolaris sorokiniana]